MLFDVVQEYTAAEKEVLRDRREKIVMQLAREHDHKKIMSFLAKSGIIRIDEKTQMVHVGVPNEFLLTQIKKFFHKSLQKTVKATFSAQYTVEYHIYAPFQKKYDELHIDMQKLFGGAISKEEKKTYVDNEESLQIAHEFGITLTPSFSFNTIVTGSHNSFAVSAAKAVAEHPGTTYNPLFIYGGVGLGKTHVIQSIGNQILAQGENKTIVYMPATTLIDAIIEAIRKNKLTQLKNKLLKTDVLLIDDVQFLANKEKTQEVFLTIFNDLAAQNKQIVLTSDQPPKELANIEARLKSRFSK